MHAMGIDADKKCQELKRLYDNSLQQLQDDQRNQLTAQLQSMSSRYDAALLEQEATMQAAHAAHHGHPLLLDDETAPQGTTVSTFILQQKEQFYEHQPMLRSTRGLELNTE